MFVAKDICAILDLGNPRSSIALLDDDEKGVHAVDTPGGKQQMTTVTENRTPKVTGKGQIYFIKRYCPKQLA